MKYHRADQFPLKLKEDSGIAANTRLAVPADVVIPTHLHVIFDGFSHESIAIMVRSAAGKIVCAAGSGK